MVFNVVTVEDTYVVSNDTWTPCDEVMDDAYLLLELDLVKALMVC